MTTNYLGLDVGGTKCAAVIGNEAGRVLARSQWPAQAARGPDAMIAELIAQARALLQGHAVAGVGVAIGGPLDTERGIVLSPPNLPGWEQVPLREVLSARLGLPVRVEHDASACALAEQLWGVPSARRLIYLTCGTGFGMGFALDRTIYYGATGRPSDIGHLRYRDDGPVAYGKRGSLEAYAAGGALARLAAWRFPQRWSAQMPTGAEVAQLAAAGDADAVAVVRLNANAVGHACAWLLDVLYPDHISLGSLAQYLGASWLGQVRTACAAEALPAALAACVIAPAALGGQVQDLAPVAAAIQTRSASRAGG